MPQLEFDSYYSQIFWLVLTFSFIYLMVSRFFIPSVNATLKSRKDSIDYIIKAAELADSERIAILHNVLEELNSAKSKATKIKNDAKAKAGFNMAAKISAHDIELSKKTAIEMERVNRLGHNMRSEISDVSDQIVTLIIKKILSEYEMDDYIKV